MPAIERSHECDLDGCDETFTVIGVGSTPFTATRTLGGKYFCSSEHRKKWRHDNPQELEDVPFFKSSRSSPQLKEFEQSVLQLVQSGNTPSSRFMKKV